MKLRSRSANIERVVLTRQNSTARFPGPCVLKILLKTRLTLLE